VSKVLFIKANNRPVEQAVSVKLYEAFLDAYKQHNPGVEITELDLYAEQLPYMDNNMINGMFKSSRGLELTEQESAAFVVASRYLEQFLAYDKIVFGFPLWNLTVPAVLHTYMDYLNQAGKTFRYTPQGAVGLLGNTKVVLLNARGGDYSAERASSEMAVNFMNKSLELFGITDITTVIVEGHNQYPDQAEARIQAGIAAAAQAAASF